MRYGDVIAYEGKHYIYLGVVKNYENAGSCSYDRVYALLYLWDKVDFAYANDSDRIEVHVKGMKIPFEKSDWPPYDVSESKIVRSKNGVQYAVEHEYKIQQRKPKLVYE